MNYDLNIPNNFDWEFPEDPIPASLLSLLTNEANRSNSLKEHGEIKDCKLLLTLASVKGIPSDQSWWRNGSEYSCNVNLHGTDRVYKLRPSAKDNRFTASSGAADSHTWEAFDYYGQTLISCTLRKKNWFFSKTMASVSITLQDLLQNQSRDPHFNPSSSSSKQDWSFTAIARTQLPCKSAPNSWNSTALQSKNAFLTPKDLCQRQSGGESNSPPYPHKPIHTIDKKFYELEFEFRYRLVFLKRCVQTSLSLCFSPGRLSCSDFHILVAFAPAFIIEEMMKILASKKLLNKALTLTTSDGLNALEMALLYGHPHVVTAMLQRAGRLCFPPLHKDKKCVLHYSVVGKNDVSKLNILARFLKLYGATPTAGAKHSMESLLQHRDELGHTPISLACSLGDHNAVKSFITLKADIGHINPVTGYTPLMYAVEKGSLEVVQYLLKQTKQDLDYNLSDEILSRHLRNHTESRKAVSRLIYTANPTHRDHRGHNALHLAVLAGRWPITKVLARVINMTDIDYCGCGVFHCAAEVGDMTLYQELVQMEAERWHNYVQSTLPESYLNLTPSVYSLLVYNNTGQTPIDAALYSNRLDVAQYLLQQAQTIYASFLKENHLKYIEEVEKQIKKLKDINNLGVEHKSSEEKDVLCSNAVRMIADSSSKDGEEKIEVKAEMKLIGEESIEHEEQQDRLNYNFALTALAARAAGIELH